MTVSSNMIAILAATLAAVLRCRFYDMHYITTIENHCPPPPPPLPTTIKDHEPLTTTTTTTTTSHQVVEQKRGQKRHTDQHHEQNDADDLAAAISAPARPHHFQGVTKSLKVLGGNRKHFQVLSLVLAGLW